MKGTGARSNCDLSAVPCVSEGLACCRTTIRRLCALGIWKRRSTVHGFGERLALSLQDLDVAMGLNILHIIQFPAMTSFKLRLGLPSFEHLEEVLDVVLSSFRDPGPTVVTDLTLSMYRPFPRDGRTPLEVISDWCGGFGELRSLALENRRFNGLGLLSFAGSIDSLQMVNSEGSVVPTQTLRNIPIMWDFTSHRSAVLDAADTHITRSGLIELRIVG